MSDSASLPPTSETAVHHDGRFMRWFNMRGLASITIGAPYLWLLVLFLIPFIIVVAMSFALRTPTSPPFSYGRDGSFLSLTNYARLFQDDLYIRAFLTSLKNAGFATLLCLLIGYPMALGLTRVSRSARNILLMLVILPFWTSFLLRVYAWIGLMGNNSWFNKLLTGAYNAMVPQAWELHSMGVDKTWGSSSSLRPVLR